MKRNVFLALMMVLFAAMFASCSPNPTGNVDSDLDIPGDPFENAPTEEEWTDVSTLSEEEKVSLYRKFDNAISAAENSLRNSHGLEDDGKTNAEVQNEDGTIKGIYRPGYAYNIEFYGYKDDDNNTYWGTMKSTGPNATNAYYSTDFVVKTATNDVYSIYMKRDADGRTYKINNKEFDIPDTGY